MSGWRITWSGTEMLWRNKRPREVVMFIMDELASKSRCSHYGHSWDTNIQHLLSLVSQLSIPISIATGACNNVSFWQVKMDTRSLQIVRWVMQVCTTSGGNNQTSTRCSEWRFMRSRKQWTNEITSPSIKVKRSSQDWKNCWTYHSMSSKSLCYLDTMIIPRISVTIFLVLKSIYITSPQVFYLFASWTTREIQIPLQNTSYTSRTWPDSNNTSISRMMRRIEISPETRSAGFMTSPVHKQLSKTMKYRNIDIIKMNVTNMSWNHIKLIYDSQINDPRSQLQSRCMPTLSQPLMRRTNTSLSCCPVWPCLESPQSTHNCKYSIHHLRKRVIFVLSWTIWFNYKRVWRDTYSMRCYWKWHRRSRKIIGLHLYIPSVTRNWRVTRWDIMHMW